MSVVRVCLTCYFLAEGTGCGGVGYGTASIRGGEDVTVNVWEGVGFLIEISSFGLKSGYI